jgi:hypothetical protein
MICKWVFFIFAGEVSEWLIEQPWKGCVGLVSTAGSNPALSVISDCQLQIENLCSVEKLLKTKIRL